MSHKDDQVGTSEPKMRDFVKEYEINVADYDDLIRALFLAAPKDPAAHAETKFDPKGSPVSTTSVSRNIDGFSLVAEDRGAVYAVWLIKIDPEEGTKMILEFRQIPWGRE